jgi:hypothetical protein
MRLCLGRTATRICKQRSSNRILLFFMQAKGIACRSAGTFIALAWDGTTSPSNKAALAVGNRRDATYSLMSNLI